MLFGDNYVEPSKAAVLRKMDMTTKEITTVAGNTQRRADVDGTGTNAGFRLILGLDIHPSGNYALATQDGIIK